MKRYALIIIIIICCTFPMLSQNVNIPDTAFLYALIDQGVDTDGDGLISYAEAEALTNLDVSDHTYSDDTDDISDLTGIEAFVNLDSLDCTRNKLSSLDVSNNNALTHLDCSFNELSSLDVSNNSALTHLDCSINELTGLDISNNNALIFLACNANQLTDLNVKNNIALEQLYCNANSFTSLDVTNCKSLNILDCAGRCSHAGCFSGNLRTLDVSTNTALEELHCAGNELANLDISNNIDLTYLDCCNNQLDSLDVSNNTSLTNLHCYGNHLTSLDISNNPNLERLRCGRASCQPFWGCTKYNQITSLDLSGNPLLRTLACANNQLVSLDVSSNVNLESLYCGENKIPSLDLSNNTQIMKLGLDELPTLNEVCIWTDPFPPDTVHVDTTGSPNVYFTTKCSDFEAPYIVAPDSLYQPEYIEATSSENGVIYLVPVNTEKDMAIICGVCVDSMEVVANVPVEVALSGLYNGVYWLYARDSSENISEPEEFSIMGVGIENNLSEQIKIYPNPANTQLTIKTGIPELYNIDIRSLNGQLLYSTQMEGNLNQIDLSSFQKGVYFITVRSRDYMRTLKIIKL